MVFIPSFLIKFVQIKINVIMERILLKKTLNFLILGLRLFSIVKN
jgi:hypothetical protein